MPPLRHCHSYLNMITTTIITSSSYLSPPPPPHTRHLSPPSPYTHNHHLMITPPSNQQISSHLPSPIIPTPTPPTNYHHSLPTSITTVSTHTHTPRNSHGGLGNLCEHVSVGGEGGQRVRWRCGSECGRLVEPGLIEPAHTGQSRRCGGWCKLSQPPHSTLCVTFFH